MIFKPPTRLAKQQCLKGLIRPDLMADLIPTVQTIRAPRKSQERTFFYPTVSRRKKNTHQGRPWSIWNAISLMKPYCYVASIDVKDAYYSMRVCSEHQEYLKIYWNGTLSRFTCFTNGSALAPTKLLKPVYSSLRKRVIFHHPILKTLS